VAHAIKVFGGATVGHIKRDGWISKWGYTTAANIESARRFGKRESAESFALLLTVKCPHYIQKLKVVCIVVGKKRGDVRWREKKEESHGTVLR